MTVQMKKVVEASDASSNASGADTPTPEYEMLDVVSMRVSHM